MQFRLISLAFAIVVSVGAHRAYAAGPDAPTADQKKAAQKMFEAGDALYESARYEDAVEAFKQSHSLVSSPNSRLMLARSLREVGKSQEACTEFSETIHDAEVSGGRYPEALQAATAELEALKAQTSADCSVQKAPKLSPSPPTTTPQTATESPKPLSTTSTTNAPNPTLRMAAWASAGVGVIGFLGFGTFGYLNLRTYGNLESDCPNGSCKGDTSTRIDKGKQYQTLANIGLGLGLVGAAASTTLFILSMPHASENSKVAILVGPASVIVDGQF
jgi:tetratricopeptide (TPR) repeat protein